jgi:tRNA(fMet)-specific endonuclease VapC
VTVRERLALDTSAYARLRVGHPRVQDAVAAATLVVVPIVVVGELLAGFDLGSRRQENLASLDDFLAEPFVEVLPLTMETARVYGQLFSSLRRAGTPIPTNDLWIAAAARAAGASLLTFDAHFRRIAGFDGTVLEA